MDFMEKYRQERDRLRAEIERSWTPEQRAEAEAIRARRLAFERLPGRVKTEMNEMEVFRAFVVAAGLNVDDGSARNAKPPEPDIWCSIAEAPYYFELGEAADTSVAHSLAQALENDEPTGGAFSQMEPFRDILTSKSGKKYVSNGSPIDLLLHYQKQTPPWKEYFDEMVDKYASQINGVLSHNPAFPL
jgi:hypothetical protein